MKRVWLFIVICIAGLALLACGLLIPAHLRAVDAGVIRVAGRNGYTPSGQQLAAQPDLSSSRPQLIIGGSLDNEIKAKTASGNLGVAQLLVQAACLADLPGSGQLGVSVTNAIRQNPDAFFWGPWARVENLFDDRASLTEQKAQTVTAFMVQQKNCEAALVHLQGSQIPAVQELLRSRSLSNTVLFPSPQSSAGQVYDTAVAISGLLLENGLLSPELKESLTTFTAAANAGQGSQPMELVLMDLMSLGQRLNWDQLTAFVGQIQNPETLHELTEQARSVNGELPVLYAAVELSGQPADVAQYVTNFKDTGFKDLTASLHYGAGGVHELVKEQQRFYDPNWERQVTAFNPAGGFFAAAANFSLGQPVFAMAVKWLCYLLAGFFLAAAMHYARPEVPPLERPLQVRGIHWFREFLFSVGFLLVVLLLSEPFLAQDNQKGDFSLRPHLPMAGGVVAAGIAGIKQNIMNPTIILTLLIFFVLQALLYIGCLVKLAEIRRQNIPPRMKLKLLENEDHLFDAGLYLGFVGTIVSLIVASLGLVKFSLMAAYSSTSFGIIFVVIFKIFHLRPARRQLLLEVEAENPAAVPPLRGAAPLAAMPS